MLRPVEQFDDRPRLDMGRGRYLRHVIDNTYEQVTLDGKHVCYLTALPVVYESTLDAQLARQRITRT